MEDQRMRKKTGIVEDGDDDRISKLSDDLIHEIMSFMDTSSQLVNLEIKAPLGTANASVWKVEVLAPKLCNFSAVELGGAKILALDLVTVQALSEISDILIHLRSPFPNLKYLKLPYGCKESDISSSVRQYLLGGSPHATIVKTLPRDDVISQMAPALPVLAQNVVLEEPSVNPTKKPTNSLYTHGKTCSDTVARRVPKGHVVDNFVVDYDKVQQIEGPVLRASSDQASSSWRLDHEVNSEFVGLLDLMKKRYPETFQKLPTENKKILTMKLNMLCSSVDAFTKTYRTEVDTKLLAE
ncbi:hypothetical protein POM88_025369 [Heracleum sosnowskyi]|uniref:Uncharacterized protein n=1 Tax=Heracleum sosnowskyi TaxID=360622 RepID=A0AAD8I6W4_9APIA|nr:hypothetical protein POM88_025369 [Heracleum sosnowskyi]